MKKISVTNEEAIAALIKWHGLVSPAAKEVGISRASFYKLLKYKAVQQARDEALEALKDKAESKIIEAIEEGNITMLIFFAKTKMKDRGYVERSEVEHSGGALFEVEISNFEKALNAVYGIPAESL